MEGAEEGVKVEAVGVAAVSCHLMMVVGAVGCYDLFW